MIAGIMKFLCIICTEIKAKNAKSILHYLFLIIMYIYGGLRDFDLDNRNNVLYSVCITVSVKTGLNNNGM